MANAKDIKAGAGFVELYLQDSRFMRGLQAVGRKFRAWGKSLAMAGGKIFAGAAGIIAPLVAAATSFSAMGDKLDKMAQRTGVSVESLSELKFAAEQSGTSIDGLGASLFRMQRRVANATSGTGPAVRALKELKLEAKDLAALSTEDQFLTIVDALAKMPNEARAAQMAFEIMGDNARDLWPLLKKGADGIEALKARARELGLTISAADATKAAELKDRMNEARQAMARLSFEFGASVAPTLADLLKTFAENARAVKNWVEQNRGLILSVLQVAGIVAGVGLAIVALGAVIGGLGAIIGTTVAAFTTAAGIIAGLFSALLSPIGLIAVALVAAAVAFVKFTTLGQNAASAVSGAFGRAFDGIAETFRVAWGGIVDAMKAGDLKLAAEIAWTAVRTVWAHALAAMSDLWHQFKNWFMSGWAAVWNGAAKFFVRVWSTMRTVHITVFSAMFKAAIGFGRGIVSIIQNSVLPPLEKVVALMEKVRAPGSGLARSLLDSADAALGAAGAGLDSLEERRQRGTDRATGKYATWERDKIAAIDAEAEAAAKAREQGRFDAAEKHRRSIEELTAELHDLRTEAAKAREKAEADAQPGDAGVPDLAGMDTAAAKTQAAGTFNPFATRSFGGHAVDQIAQNTKDTAKHTRRMQKALDAVPFAFT